MDPKFAKLVDSLAPKLKELLAMKPVRYRAIPMTLPIVCLILQSRKANHRVPPGIALKGSSWKSSYGTRTWMSVEVSCHTSTM